MTKADPLIDTTGDGASNSLDIITGTTCSCSLSSIASVNPSTSPQSPHSLCPKATPPAFELPVSQLALYIGQNKSVPAHRQSPFA
ncbi:hypothetical protein EJ06DRAFT_529203 [Trichodelitschia bisporula]|uniref:Uncharacterized protein n=1 Tax=Trichodelitschia bisporula TaxID=703511 RepID=A0A6G1I1N1_9PEZI|nr:hypothetical protein EJ06DRAFT_529203 [Trichodelitschia bisporula]